jgi:hypothetical protein
LFGATSQARFSSWIQHSTSATAASLQTGFAFARTWLESSLARFSPPQCGEADLD